MRRKDKIYFVVTDDTTLVAKLLEFNKKDMWNQENQQGYTNQHVCEHVSNFSRIAEVFDNHEKGEAKKLYQEIKKQHDEISYQEREKKEQRERMLWNPNPR